ncbi:hypothetical protein C1M51_15690 [Methylibium sp. Pch-M]|uniref:hypothetical protein n=1 Tax=Methylibium sp. Pch-M TaxID=2082386 RepID=UPI001011E3CB|nr:hypothetical protein [Methylibium sp. Pch-M]QAZ40751.1 hypothetical protein C1M51_15690 [Methylibium sp. Pch-M]
MPDAWDDIDARHAARNGRALPGNSSTQYTQTYLQELERVKTQRSTADPAPVATGSEAYGGGGTDTSSGPLSLGQMASGGAWLCAVLVVGYGYLGMNLGLAQLAVYGAVAAVAGALAGAALHITIQLLAIAFKIAVGALAIGVCLHLLGALDLFQVLRQLSQALAGA